MSRRLLAILLLTVAPATSQWARPGQSPAATFMAPAISPTLAQATDMTTDRQSQILRDALNAFDDAVARAQDDPAQARRLYRRAATDFEALTAAGLRNAALEYNLGNTYFRLDELGRAILHYRRALRLDPSHEKLRANLAYARREVEPHIAPSGQDRLLHRLLFWHYGTSLGQRYWAAAVLSVIGWLLLIVRLRRPARPLLILGMTAVLLSLAAGTSVVWQANQEASHPPAVIVQDKYVLRLGRGEGHDPALRQPLGPGVELRILQQRGDWIEVRLPNDQTGWLPAAAVERI